MLSHPPLTKSQTLSITFIEEDLGQLTQTKIRPLQGNGMAAISKKQFHLALTLPIDFIRSIDFPLWGWGVPFISYGWVLCAWVWCSSMELRHNIWSLFLIIQSDPRHPLCEQLTCFRSFLYSSIFTLPTPLQDDVPGSRAHSGITIKACAGILGT